MSAPLLTLSQFSVSFADKPILRQISFELAEVGMLLLMGPVGSGKSTLLRTLAGLNRASQALLTDGWVRYCGETLIDADGNFNANASELPAIVAQKTQLLIANIRENIVGNLPERSSLTQLQQRELVVRLLEQAGAGALIDQLDTSVKDLTLGQQRLIALIRTMASNPRLVLIDEPTAGIAGADTELILNFLKQQAERRAIITVLHHQQQAKFLAGQIALLVDGEIIERGDCAAFFSQPQTELGQMFVRTGSCCKQAQPDECDDEYEQTYTAPSSPGKFYSTRPKPVSAVVTPSEISTSSSLPSSPAIESVSCHTALATAVANNHEAATVPNAASSINCTAPVNRHQACATSTKLAFNASPKKNAHVGLSALASSLNPAQLSLPLIDQPITTSTDTACGNAPLTAVKSAAFGPRNFHWLLPGKLAGTPRPGLVRDIGQDLAALARVGITQLISLESEFPATDSALLSQHGLQGFSLPMADMSAPSMDAALACCQRVSALIAAGERVAFHCKAGIGRTGTLLVAYLIYTGQPRSLALTSARAIEPRWVQSATQEKFLDDFASYLASSQKNAAITSANLNHTTN